MATAIINYDKDLPEIRGRRPWERPTSHLVKDDDAPNGWREDESGRRPSRLLLVPEIRGAVDAWRDGSYPGASEVTRRLFEYWFEEDHEVAGFDVPFRYYFCQREAIETLVWLIEIVNQRDARTLIDAYGTVFQRDLFSKSIEFHTTMEGKRQVHRYVPELESEGRQELPPENLPRFAFKMATGSGKTWVMAMAIVWSYLHKQHVAGSKLSTNALVVAPNVIVYQRLEKDFANNRIFQELPLVPPEWKGGFSQKVTLRGDGADPSPSGNLFLTNIQQLYESRDEEWTPENPVERLLGRKPLQDLASSGRRSMLERIGLLGDLLVLNDEAHHVHNDELEWNKSLLSIHDALPCGLSAWLDFSATPKDQKGMYFPWTVVDYPLAQAVEDRIVKAPIIVTNENQPVEDPDGVTRENVAEKYGYWLQAAVESWKRHRQAYQKLGVHPVLFIVTERSVHADALGEYLWRTKELGFQKSEVLVIHTNARGEITERDLEQARRAARDIDKEESGIKAIVSVMMLREGWDVRNVTVVLGLRPFSSKAEILPEQVIGRGLRLMTEIGPDRTQTLEVLGTRNLLNVLHEKLEMDGVGVARTTSTPPPPVTIEPMEERLEYDIAIPIPKPSLERNFHKLSGLRVQSLGPIYDQEDLAKAFQIRLRHDFATTKTKVHEADVFGHVPGTRELLVRITNLVANKTGLTSRFADLYPLIQDYVRTRCFGRDVELDDRLVRSHLNRVDIREGTAKYMARQIGKLTVERRKIEFSKQDHHLSETKPFSWRRNLPLLKARKTVFNLVATYNNFERRFAEFLDGAGDVLRFAALGTTEQGGSSTVFRVDYLKANGAVGYYYPDWVAVQRNADGEEVNWIIETKGRVWEGTDLKDAAMQEWCGEVTEATGIRWKYARVNQKEFRSEFATLRQAVEEETEREEWLDGKAMKTD